MGDNKISDKADRMKSFLAKLEAKKTSNTNAKKWVCSEIVSIFFA